METITNGWIDYSSLYTGESCCSMTKWLNSRVREKSKIIEKIDM